jgi:tryptophan-rich sensory protein
LAGLLTQNATELYGQMAVKPPFSPPAWLFPVAWTILYLMMGYASYLVWRSQGSKKQIEKALTWYGAQLAANFLWSPLFFQWKMYLAALILLIVLVVLVVITLLRFRQLNATAGWLLVPYLCWLLFAGYLNAGVWLLQR